MSKTKKQLKYIPIIIILLLISIIYIKQTTTIDNYFAYINQEDIDSKDKEWSYLNDLSTEINDQLKTIIEDKINNPTSNEENNIKQIYNNYKNINQEDSINILKKYINTIQDTKNINEFILKAIDIEKELNIDIFTSKTIMQDFKEENNIIYFTTIPMDYGFNQEYYTNEDLKTIRAYFKLYNNKLLQEYGYTQGEALDISNQIDKFYETIAQASITNSKLLNTENYYNIVNQQDLQKIYTNININSYFKQLGLQNENKFSIVDENCYKKLNELLTEENLEIWKNIVTIKILQNYSEYTNENYNQIITSLNEKLTNTKPEEYIYEIIKTYYPNEISKMYNETNPLTTQKETVTTLTQEIITEYKNMINNSWMESQTKEKAISKLNNLKINIGNKYIKDYASYYNYNNDITLLENIININKTINTQQLKQLSNNQYYPSLPDYMVNAYYDITDNSINILSGLTTIVTEDRYENLGKIGTIIAHEISHAFDNNGSKFDEKGKLNNWYTDKDKKEYEQIQNKIIEYYNEYEIIHDIKNNGTKTIGENIADMAAMECITNIIINKNPTKENIKKVFTSYAKLWSNNYSNSAKVSQSLIDTHSPNEIRVNAVLSSNNLFNEIYNINKKDNMYVEQTKRVKIW